MLDEAARWDDLVTGLHSMSYGAKGVPARCLVSLDQRPRRRPRAKGGVFAFAPTRDKAQKIAIEELHLPQTLKWKDLLIFDFMRIGY
jgi:hypothetical protein